MTKIPHRLYLTEDQMPQKWFNLRAAMPELPDPDPPRHPPAPGGGRSVPHLL